MQKLRVGRLHWRCWPALWLLGLSTAAWPAPAAEQQLRYGHFGEIHLYLPATTRRVVIFLSGDDGWQAGVVDMARQLAQRDIFVAGIDTAAYLAQLRASDSKCAYPAGDLEALSQYLQKRFALPTYITPLLIGYSSGATLVYGVLAQSPPNTFRGGISLGFCTSLPLSKPFCPGFGLRLARRDDARGYDFLPSPRLSTPWLVLQGAADTVCDTASAARFTAAVGNSRYQALPGVGHGYGQTARWLAPFLEGVDSLSPPPAPTAAAAASALPELPLIEVPVAQPGNTFAVILSGDGGWAGIDKSLAEALQEQGVPSVGLDSLRYFWKRRNPEEAARDVAAIMRHYLDAWHRQSVLLIGYSRGADVLPFVANRLPPELQARTALLAMLVPSRSVDFEFRVADWLPGGGDEGAYAVRPETEKLAFKKMLCMYGEEEKHSLCPDLDANRFSIVRTGGGHHFDGDYKKLADVVLETAELRRESPAGP